MWLSQKETWKHGNCGFWIKLFRINRQFKTTVLLKNTLALSSSVVAQSNKNDLPSLIVPS